YIPIHPCPPPSRRRRRRPQPSHRRCRTRHPVTADSPPPRPLPPSPLTTQQQRWQHPTNPDHHCRRATQPATTLLECLPSPPLYFARFLPRAGFLPKTTEPVVLRMRWVSAMVLVCSSDEIVSAMLLVCSSDERRTGR
uniref:Uncharacterized protein n=1 Tax=Triticum urartu TaxID=4572 RepID=A0A8R7QC59_TRIUA